MENKHVVEVMRDGSISVTKKNGDSFVIDMKWVQDTPDTRLQTVRTAMHYARAELERGTCAVHAQSVGRGYRVVNESATIDPEVWERLNLSVMTKSKPQVSLPNGEIVFLRPEQETYAQLLAQGVTVNIPTGAGRSIILRRALDILEPYHAPHPRKRGTASGRYTSDKPSFEQVFRENHLVLLVKDFVAVKDIHEPIADNGATVADWYKHELKQALDNLTNKVKG